MRVCVCVCVCVCVREEIEERVFQKGGERKDCETDGEQQQSEMSETIRV